MGLGTLRTSPEQATVNALATYLRTQLDSDIVVTPHWPEGELPTKAVTILMVGAADETDVNATYIRPLGSTPPDTAPRPLYTYAITELTLRLQIDIWGMSDAARDDICAQLHDAVHQGLGVTLGPAFSDDPFRDGILLASDDPDTYIDFTFEGSPTRDNTVDAPLRREYRATLRGDARFVHTLKAGLPRFTTGILRQNVGETTASHDDLITVTKTTVTVTDP